MITKKTVFITGAGASSAYGFPIGKTYKESIVKAARELNDQLYYTKLNGRNVWDYSDVVDLISKFEKSDFNSFDDWISLNSNKSKVLKMIMAHAMIIAESKSNIHECDDKDNYLKTIWLKVIDGVNSYEDYFKNNVSFVTFNYDRSIEYYLWENINSSFGDCTDGQKIEMFEHIKIFHVYGSIPFYVDSYENTQLRDYLAFENKSYIDQNYFDLLCDISYKLRIVPDLKTDLFSHVVFDSCNKIIILGFGFDKNNVSLLNLNSSNHSGNIISTCKSLSNQRKDELKLQMRKFNGMYRLTFSEETIVDVLNKYLNLPFT